MTEWGSARDGRKPAGIDLLNNHCYRNAAFAGLLHLPRMLTMLENHQNYCDWDENDMCITCALASLVEPYWSMSPKYLREFQQPLQRVTRFVNSFNETLRDIRNKDEDDEGLDPEEVEQIRERKDYVADLINVSFRNGTISRGQQDIADFLRWIFHNLGRGTDDLTIDTTSNNLFLTQTIGEWYCQECDTSVTKRNGRPDENKGVVTINTIDTTVPDGVLVPLEKFLRERWFWQQNPIKCDICSYSKQFKPEIDDNLVRDSRERISTSPEYLVLQVTNYTMIYGSDVKGVNKVRIPMWLDLNEHRHESFEGSSNDLRYKLWSTIFHTGGAYEGHYEGIFVGPCGPTSIDNRKVTPNTSPDRMGSRYVRSRMTTNIVYNKEDEEIDRYKENTGRSPYILIYKRLKPPAQQSEEARENGPEAATTLNAESPGTKGTGSSGRAFKGSGIDQPGVPSKRKSAGDQPVNSVEPEQEQRNKAEQRKRRKMKSK